MIYTFVRIGAALKMRVEDVYTLKGRTWIRLDEKRTNIKRCRATRIWRFIWNAYITGAGLAGNPKALLFPTALKRGGPLFRPSHDPSGRLPDGRAGAQRTLAF